jgi:hypothetical protein
MELQVDEGIADTLLMLWAHGYQTTNSCQDNEPHGTGRHWIWIQFTMESFVKLVEKTFVDDQAYNTGGQSVNLVAWLVRFGKFDTNWWSDDVGGVEWGVSVRFPATQEKHDEFDRLFLAAHQT